MFFKIVTTDRYTILKAIYEILDENNFCLQKYTHFNGLGHKQKSWVKYTMGGVSYRNFWTSITQVREIIRGCPFTEL